MNTSPEVRILLVDDSPDLDVLIAPMQRRGWQASIARNGEEAIRQLEQHDFDAVVLDRNMPRISGDEVLRWLHEEFVGVMPCVVMLTGYPATESAAAALEYEAYRYLTKPVEPEALIRILRPGIALHRCKKMTEALLTTPKEDLFWTAKEILTVACEADGAVVVFVDEFRNVQELYGHPTSEKPNRLRFVDRLLAAGGKRLYLKTRQELEGMDPMLKEAGSLMAVPVRSDDSGYRGVLEMESRKEQAFDAHWTDLLRHLANLIGLASVIQDRSSASLLYREFRHSTATHAQVIAMQASQLREKDLDEVNDELRERIRKRVNSISDHAVAIQTVVDDLRTATADLPLVRRPADLSEILRGAVERSTEECAQESIDVAFIFDQQPMAIMGDAAWLEYCLTCVLTNAKEAIESEKGAGSGDLEGKIRVTVHRANRDITIIVSDTGVGIPRESLELIFQPLFSTKTRSANTTAGNPSEFLNSFITGLTRAMVQHPGLRRVPPTATFSFQPGTADSSDKLIVCLDPGSSPQEFKVPPGEFSKKRGIGLYTVRRVIHWHGGTISVASDGLHQGATVTIILPIART
jgi:signal transduction histidine kinase/ActR/RegA family two-component response regulator